MRRNNFFWGSLILILGILLLFGQMFPGFNAWGVFWPLILILLGLWFLVGRSWVAGGRTDLAVEQASVPLADIREARIRFHHGAGKLDITPGETPGMLMSGSFTGGVEQRLNRDGSSASLEMRTRTDVFTAWPFGFYGGLSWNVALTREIPLKLELETGASETRANLQELLVSELVVKTGASSTVIHLPANAGQTKVSVQSGVASVELVVPQGVAGRIRVQSGLAGIQIDPARFPAVGGGYETPGYDAAPNKIEINVETGVGSVTIR